MAYGVLLKTRNASGFDLVFWSLWSHCPVWKILDRVCRLYTGKDPSHHCGVSALLQPWNNTAGSRQRISFLSSNNDSCSLPCLCTGFRKTTEHLGTLHPADTQRLWLNLNGYSFSLEIRILKNHADGFQVHLNWTLIALEEDGGRGCMTWCFLLCSKILGGEPTGLLCANAQWRQLLMFKSLSEPASSQILLL